MKERIKDKIKEITEFLEFLSQRVPDTLEEYKSNLEKKAICERYFEKVIEAIVDLSFLLIRHLKIEIPAETSDTEIFYILAEKHIISKSETCLAESFNANLRYYLARLHRKTKCYSKCRDMLLLSVLMLKFRPANFLFRALITCFSKHPCHRARIILVITLRRISIKLI